MRPDRSPYRDVSSTTKTARTPTSLKKTSDQRRQTPHPIRHRHQTTPEDHWHYNIGPNGPRFTDGGSMEHYQHARQFNLRTPRRSRAPHTQGPPPPDAEGEPWCDCCTAYLSEDDNTQQGLRDQEDQSIRYRCRHEEDPPPTHSNLHRGYLRIFRSNELYQNDQRSHQYKTMARMGNHATQQPTSTYANTEEMADLQNSLANLQFQRYRGRGGRFSQAQHTMRSRDHRYNSPNHHNMAIGQSYRKWFKKTISRRHYSLGEATEYYMRWLEDPNKPLPKRTAPRNRIPRSTHTRRLPLGCTAGTILSGPPSISAHTPSSALRLGRGIRHGPTLQQLRTNI